MLWLWKSLMYKMNIQISIIGGQPAIEMSTNALFSKIIKKELTYLNQKPELNVVLRINSPGPQNDL